MKNVALDLDGTIIEKKWPEMGDWLPGAREGIRQLIDSGHRCFIYSARLSSKHPSGDQRDPAEVIAATQAVRDLLDEAGLHEVDIWPGDKPFFHILIDDRAMWFPGRKNSWRAMVPKILFRLGEKHGQGP